MNKIEIFLKKCKLEIPQLTQAIHRVDRKVLDSEKVDLLVKTLPGNEVMSLWKNEEDLKDFNDCDVFLSGLSKVNGFR